MIHASLFSGIGGFDLAASWMGWKNAFNCEIDEFCTKVLKYQFPNTIHYDDIKNETFTNWGGKLTSSREDFHANLSVSPESEKERKMTVTYGRKCFEQYAKFTRLGLLVKMLVESEVWYNKAVHLRWKAKQLSSEKVTRYKKQIKNTSSKPYVKTLNVKDIPCNRCLYQLAPSVRHTDEIGYGLLPTVITSDSNAALTEHQKEKFMNRRMKLSNRVPSCVTQLRQLAADNLLPTPLATDVNHSERVENLRKKNVSFHSRINGESRPNGLTDYLQFNGLLLTPSATDGMRANFSMDSLKNHNKANAEKSNLAEQISHVVDGGTSRLNPLFVEEMMGFPTDHTVKPFQKSIKWIELI